MLTPTDVHYLIDLLFKISGTSNDEIELGAMVPDESTGEERDVDITISQKSLNGDIKVYKGIEVKKEGRPLDVIHVEQLCIKLLDMPSITHKSIVSANGYTAQAVKKANYHGIQLLEIKSINNPFVGFGNVIFYNDGGIPFFENEVVWVEKPKVYLGLDELGNLSEEEINQLLIVDENGNPYPNTQYITSFSNSVASMALSRVKQEPIVFEMQDNEQKNIIVNFPSFLPEPFIHMKDTKMRIKNVVVEGVVIKKATARQMEFKGLFKYGADKPDSLYSLTEISTNSLVGLASTGELGSFHLLHISQEERLRKRIYKQKLV